MAWSSNVTEQRGPWPPQVYSAPNTLGVGECERVAGQPTATGGKLRVSSISCAAVMGFAQDAGCVLLGGARYTPSRFSPKGRV